MVVTGLLVTVDLHLGKSNQKAHTYSRMCVHAKFGVSATNFERRNIQNVKYRTKRSATRTIQIIVFIAVHT